jgi:hypothetical protein
MMMRTLDPRPFALLGALVAGALVAVAVTAVAGSDPAVWVAVAGAAACACGLVVGSTARVLPAAVLAGVASAALVLSVGGDETRAPEVRAYTVPTTLEAVPRTEPPRAEQPAPPPPLTRHEFVRRYYAALEAGRFGQAWGRLGPAVRARSMSFEAWRAGYATAISNRVEDVSVEPDGSVRHVLVTVDRTPCGGTTEQRYEMLWYLQRDGRTFTARDVVGVQLAGVAPALACG